MAQLNNEQREVVDRILSAVDEYEQTSSQAQEHCFFIDGDGGTGEFSMHGLSHLHACTTNSVLCCATFSTTGKTLVYNTLTSILRGRDQNVAAKERS